MRLTYVGYKKEEGVRKFSNGRITLITRAKSNRLRRNFWRGGIKLIEFLISLTRKIAGGRKTPDNEQKGSFGCFCILLSLPLSLSLSLSFSLFYAPKETDCSRLEYAYIFVHRYKFSTCSFERFPPRKSPVFSVKIFVIKGLAHWFTVCSNPCELSMQIHSSNTTHCVKT